MICNWRWFTRQNKRMQRGMVWGVIAALCIAGFSPMAAAGAARNKIYNIYPFTEDQVLALPLNGTAYYFKLSPFHRLAENNYFDIVYTHSSTIKDDQSMLTVVLNDIPIASRKMDLKNEEYTSWRVVLDKQYFKDGFNELKIMTNQRTITEGLCRDVDNPANWLVLSKDSLLHLEAGLPEKKLLSYWPYPFLDNLDPAPPGFVFRANLEKTGVLPSLLTLASDLGRSARQQDFSAVGLRRETEKNLQPAREINLALTVQSEKYPAGTGLAALSGSNPTSILVAGKDSPGLERIVALLNDTDTVSQITDSFFATSSGYPPQEFDRAKSRGYFALSDFAAPGINISGAFHQMTTINILRPAGWQVGEGSYLELHFRHSAALKPDRSLMTVYVNRIPVTSISLNASNLEKGVLRVEIPKSELSKDWQIAIACYHDIGLADCSKRYEEVAWTYIEGDSPVYLAPGKVAQVPSLRAFPALNTIPGLPEHPVTAVLSKKAAADLQQLLLTTALRAGQNAGDRVVWQSTWLEDSAEQTDKLKGDIIVVARREELARYEKFTAGMPIQLDSKGKYQIDPALPLSSGSLQDAVVFQAGKNPFDASGIAYLLVVDGKLDLAKAVALIAEPELNRRFTGDVAILSQTGALQTYQVGKASGSMEEEDNIYQKLSAIFAGPSAVWRIYALMVGVVILGMILSIYFTRRRQDKR